MRIYSLIIILAVLLLSNTVFGFSVVKNGKAVADVILKNSCTEAEKYAAEEFVVLTNKMFGAKPEIKNSPEKKYSVYIGQSDEAAKIAGIKDWQDFDDDEILIFCKGNNLVLSGGKGSGVIYSVYHFFDEYYGVKYITSDDTYFPSVKSSDITKSIYLRYKSPFMSRESFFKQFNENPEYCLKLKMNGHFNNIKPELGGHVELLGWAHTFDLYLPFKNYGKEHPDWYSFRNGKRLNNEYSQLCLSNGEMVAELIKKVIEALDKNPNTKIISVTQNDNKNYCECPECMALTEKCGHSGALLTVVNRVADAVKEKYPNCLVETFAYNYTRHAPKNISPRDNVIIRLCSIEADFGKTFDQPSNEDFYRNIENWSKITKNLYIWDYIVDFANYTILHPNFHVLQKNLQIMKEHNAVAVFEQGDSFNSNACLHNYKRYITAKLLWDPYLDMEKETKAFMNAYYGPAGKDMDALVKYINSAVAENPVYMGTYIADNNFFSAENWTKMFELLYSAEKKAKNTKYYDRVKMDQICLFAGLLAEDRNTINTVMKSRFSPFKNTSDALKTINEFVPEHGLTFFAETRPWETGAYAISITEKNVGKTPDVCKGLKDTDWYEVQDNNLSSAGILFDGEEYRKLVDDPGASNGKALRITSGSKEWYIQRKLSNLCYDKSINTADVYIDLKIAPGKTAGKAIEIGVYDISAKANVFTVYLGADDTPGNAWKSVKLGTLDFTALSSSAYLYICGMGDENLSDEILVDRVFFVLHR